MVVINPLDASHDRIEKINCRFAKVNAHLVEEQPTNTSTRKSALAVSIDSRTELLKKRAVPTVNAIRGMTRNSPHDGNRVRVAKPTIMATVLSCHTQRPPPAPTKVPSAVTNVELTALNPLL